MSERSVYKIVGGEEDVAGIARRVAQITVSAIKQMPVLASKVEDCISLGQGIADSIEDQTKGVGSVFKGAADIVGREENKWIRK